MSFQAALASNQVWPAEISQSEKRWIFHVIYMKDPGIGGSQAFMREKIELIFLTIGDTPINVYIERKLRVSRFWKFKNFSFFDAFLYPKRYLSENMGFWVFEVGIQIFS